MTRNPMFDLDEDDADARAVDRAYANAPEAPGPVHRIPAIDAVRAELAATRAELEMVDARLNETRNERETARYERESFRDQLAEMKQCALLAIDAKRHGSQLDYENFVGLLLNALAGSAAVGMPGEGVAVRGEGANGMACDDVALRVVGGGR